MITLAHSDHRVGTPICPSVGLQLTAISLYQFSSSVGTPICPSVGLQPLCLPTLRCHLCRNADFPECGIATATLLPQGRRRYGSERRFARVWDCNTICLPLSLLDLLSRNADLPECGI